MPSYIDPRNGWVTKMHMAQRGLNFGWYSDIIWFHFLKLFIRFLYFNNFFYAEKDGQSDADWNVSNSPVLTVHMTLCGRSSWTMFLLHKITNRLFYDMHNMCIWMSVWFPWCNTWRSLMCMWWKGVYLQSHNTYQVKRYWKCCKWGWYIRMKPLSMIWKIMNMNLTELFNRAD